jgi:hypothetical protein
MRLIHEEKKMTKMNRRDYLTSMGAQRDHPTNPPLRRRLSKIATADEVVA